MGILNIVSTVAVIISSIILIINLTLMIIFLWERWRLDQLRHKIARLEFRIGRAIEEELKKNIKDNPKSPNQSISLCTHCYCMTYTIGGRCGKCGGKKGVMNGYFTSK